MLWSFPEICTSLPLLIQSSQDQMGFLGFWYGKELMPLCSTWSIILFLEQLVLATDMEKILLSCGPDEGNGQRTRGSWSQPEKWPSHLENSVLGRNIERLIACWWTPCTGLAEITKVKLEWLPVKFWIPAWDESYRRARNAHGLVWKLWLPQCRVGTKRKTECSERRLAVQPLPIHPSVCPSIHALVGCGTSAAYLIRTWLYCEEICNASAARRQSSPLL